MTRLRNIRAAAVCASAGLAIVIAGTSLAAAAGSDSHSSMHSTSTIVQAAVNSPQHTTLVAAVTAAGLAETLSGAGPFTVFAPTNAAFARLPAGTVDTLLEPANRATLQAVLTYHVVPGRVTAAELVQRIHAGGGSARLTTVQGGTLTARMDGSIVVLVDEKGGSARVTQADLLQANGVIHVTDAVSLPG